MTVIHSYVVMYMYSVQIFHKFNESHRRAKSRVKVALAKRYYFLIEKKIDFLSIKIRFNIRKKKVHPQTLYPDQYPVFLFFFPKKL